MAFFPKSVIYVGDLFGVLDYPPQSLCILICILIANKLHVN